MAETAADRKKAKEAYMKALEDQRLSKLNESAPQTATNESRPSNQALTAAEKREQMLEERRRNFFDKKTTEPLQTVPPLSFGNQQVSHGNSSVLPFEMQPKPSARMPTVSEYDVQTAPPIDFSKPQPAVNNYNYGTQLPVPSLVTSLVPDISIHSNNSQQQKVQSVMPIDERDAKRKKQEEYTRGLQADLVAAKVKADNEQQQQQHNYDQRNPQHSGLTNFSDANNSNDKHVKDNAKKLAQQEYARQLDSQQQFQQQQQQQQQHGNPNPRIHGGVSEPVSSFNIGRGGASDKDNKRAKQEEYARELQHQQQVAQSQKTNKPHSAAGGGALSGLGDVDYDHKMHANTLKQQQQQEYARQLQSDRQTQNSHHTQHTQQQGHEAAVPSFNIGRAVDNEKELKRQKQAEYTRGLDNQLRQKEMGGGGQHSNQHDQHRHYEQSSQVAEGFNIGGGGASDKDIKRAKQEEYARELQLQQQAAQSQKNNKPHSAAGGGALNGLGGGGVDFNEAARLRKVQQQQEYARQLDIERNYSKQIKQQQQDQSERRGGNLMDNAHNQLSNQQYPQYEQHQQQQQQQQQQYGMAALGMPPVNNVDAKRAKQQEYANALLQQQLFHQQSKENQSNRNKVADLSSQNQQAAVTTPGGGLDPGWMIGPLGVPVRKTLEVGNRGVQKAFTNQTVLSPDKNRPGGIGFPPSAAAAYGIPNDSHSPQSYPYGNNPYQPTHGGGGAGYGMDQVGNNFGQPTDMYNPHQQYGAVPSMVPNLQFQAAPGGAVSMLGGDLDERAQHQKALKADQARVLKEQMEANKLLKQQEKDKLRMEEEALAMKLAKQQQELIAAHDKAEKERKQKEYDDNQAAILRQAAEKKQAKVDEENKQKELDRKEDEKIRREQEILAQKERDEIRKEAENARRLEQQQEKSHSNSPKRGPGVVRYTSPEKQYNSMPHSSRTSQPQSRQLDVKKGLFDPVEKVENTFRARSAGNSENNSAVNTGRDKSHLFDAQQENLSTIPTMLLQMPSKNKYVNSTTNAVDESDYRPQSRPISGGHNRQQQQRNQVMIPSPRRQIRVQDSPRHDRDGDYDREDEEEVEERLPRSRQRQQNVQNSPANPQESHNPWTQFTQESSSQSQNSQNNKGGVHRAVQKHSPIKQPRMPQQQSHAPPVRQSADFQQQTTARGTEQGRMPTNPFHQQYQSKVENPPVHINISQPPPQRPKQETFQNQYNKHNSRHANDCLDSSSRLDKTLQFESKFILPGGEVFSTHSHTDDNALKLSDNEIMYNNYINKVMPHEETKGADKIGNLTDILSNMNWNDSIQLNKSVSNNQSSNIHLQNKDKNSLKSPDKKHKSDHHNAHNKPVVINKDTQLLISEFKDSLHSLMTPRVDDKHSGIPSPEKKKLAESNSTSEMDIDKVYRKNRRRADVLNKLNGANPSVPFEHCNIEDVYQSIADIHSRPSTAGSTRPSTVFNTLISAVPTQGGVSGSKLSAADEYMHNYRLNKSKSEKTSLNTKLTKLNLDALLSDEPSQSRPQSGRNQGYGIANLLSDNHQYGDNKNSKNRLPLSARGRSIIESSGNVPYRGENQINSTIQHHQQQPQNQNYYNQQLQQQQQQQQQHYHQQGVSSSNNNNNNNQFHSSSHDYVDDDDSTEFDNYSEYGL